MKSNLSRDTKVAFLKKKSSVEIAAVAADPWRVWLFFVCGRADGDGAAVPVSGVCASAA